MLYDPKWDVKSDRYSLEALIEWLEQQPASAEYDWIHPDKCLLAQFAQSRGLTRWRDIVEKSIELAQPGCFDGIAFGPGPFTFGAALERARKQC